MGIFSNIIFWSFFFSLIAVAVSFWTFYKNFWESADITLNIGDQIDIVKSVDNSTNKIHIACTFFNSARKLGIVNKVAILVKKIDASDYFVFRWHLFFIYKGGHIAHPSTKICPISVPGNSGILQGIQFISNELIKWEQGKYKIRVIGWLNKRCPLDKADFNDEFIINLDDKFVTDLNKEEKLAPPQLRAIEVEGKKIVKGKMAEKF